MCADDVIHTSNIDTGVLAALDSETDAVIPYPAMNMPNNINNVEDS